MLISKLIYFQIQGFYQYCWDDIMGSNSLSRQPYVMMFGECRCLASSVTPNCEDVTQFETRFVAPELPGTYTIMVGSVSVHVNPKRAFWAFYRINVTVNNYFQQ